MSDYLIHDSTLEDIADAIRSKTGGSSLIAPEDMPTEIAGIIVGVLPTGITNMGSGSFTFASRTASTEKIYHGLDFTPKVVIVWCTDNQLAYNDMFYYLLASNMAINYSDTSCQRLMVYRSTAGAVISSASDQSISGYIYSDYFYPGHGSYYYKANTVYNWIAFA